MRRQLALSFAQVGIVHSPSQLEASADQKAALVVCSVGE
jgi:hypothetical protein